MADVPEKATDEVMESKETSQLTIDKQRDNIEKIETSEDILKSSVDTAESHNVPLQDLQNKTTNNQESTTGFNPIIPSNNSSANSTANIHTVTVNNNSNIHVNIEQQLQKSKRELENMVLRYANSERENLQNKKKVEDLDKKLKRAIKDNDQLANRIKLLTNDKNQLTDNLNAKVAQLTVLEQKNSYLNNVQGVKLTDCEEKLKKLEIVNEDLMAQIESYKSKEGELLDFSERLSMKHMLLQNEVDEALKKIPNYKDFYETALLEKEEMSKTIENLESEISELKLNLQNQQDCSNSLMKDLEKNEIKYKHNIDELQNEIKVIRRKHQIATKELIKEIKQLQAKSERASPQNLLESSKISS